MKKILLFLSTYLLFICAKGQGVVFTLGGTGTATGDNILATTASANPAGVVVDKKGNVYYADYPGTIRKIDKHTGFVQTIAGSINNGFSGDGGLAINAQFGAGLQGLWIDAADNIYIADQGNNRVRKITAATGIITTVIGGGDSTSDGVTASQCFVHPYSVFVDDTGNIYTNDYNRVRKLQASTGLVYTIAGGSGLSENDYIPATQAAMSNIKCINLDTAGNLYILCVSVGNGDGQLLRKVDAATGLIHTIAGGGDTTFGENFVTYNDTVTVGTDANLDYSITGFTLDHTGNIYVGGASTERGILKLDAATGFFYPIGGIGPGGAYSDSAGVILNTLNPYFIFRDSVGNFYYTDYVKIVKVQFVPPGFLYPSDSFYTYLDQQCNKVSAFIGLPNYNYNNINYVKTLWGDGTIDSTTFIASNLDTAIAFANHIYATSGSFTITQVLYNASSAIDSNIISYYNINCSAIPIEFYRDANNNCIKDVNEQLNAYPVTTEIDLNNVPIDTVITTSGMYYEAYGNAGDIYTFKAFSAAGNMQISCPANSTLSYTLADYITPPVQYFGMSCGATQQYDLSVYAANPYTGTAGQIGYISAGNSSCTATDATVTAHFNQHYLYTGIAYPVPSSYGPGFITWSLTGLSGDVPASIIEYELNHNPDSSTLSIYDTAVTTVTITPTSNDNDLSNNSLTLIDTVKSSFDPNYIEVSPQGCINTGAKLTYTIEFQNTGNTAAHNIYVLDTLSDQLNINTFSLLMATHHMNISLYTSGGNNIIKFDFPNINLPDSSYHNESVGMLTYSINAKNSIANNTFINGRAGIYFDDNEVVLTNTIQNKAGCTLSVNQPENIQDNITVYPNPANDRISIQADKNTYKYLSITNALGIEVVKQLINANTTVISVKALPSGIYNVSLQGDRNIAVKKFVKL